MRRLKNPKGLSLSAVAMHVSADSMPPSSSDISVPSGVSPASSRILYEVFPPDIQWQPTHFPLEELHAIWMSLSLGHELPPAYHVALVTGVAELSDGMQSGMSMQALRIWKDGLYQDVLYKKAAGSDIRLYQLIEEAAQKVHEEGIVPLYGVNFSDSPHELSACMMPLIPGGNLKKYLPVIQACLQCDREALQQGALWFLLECVTQVSQTLSFLHTTNFDDSHIPYATIRDGRLEHINELRPSSPMVHCDIKGANVLVDLDGIPPHFQVIDFGTSRTVSRLSTQDRCYEGGSQSYFSPARWISLAEDLSQYLDEDIPRISKSLSPTAYDLWSLGIIIAEALGIDGQHLFLMNEGNQIESMILSLEYLKGRKYISVEKTQGEWVMVWKDPLVDGVTDELDTKAFDSEMKHCKDLTALLHKMLSVRTQFKEDLLAQDPQPPLTTAMQISMRCRALLDAKKIAHSEKQEFLEYLRQQCTPRIL